MKYLNEGPAAFLSGKHYDIVWSTTEKGVAWVEVNGKNYYDNSSGILRSEEKIHKVTVPQSELDAAKEYTICFRRVLNRKPYFPEAEDIVQTKKFKFFPVLKGKDLKVYVLGDCHDFRDAVMKVGKYYGDDLDMLVLNGDVSENRFYDELITATVLSQSITKGEKPTLYVRGNHDLRGELASEMLCYAGTDNEKFYFTFTAGDIFGIVLDGGEDKPDTSKEYGNLAAFSAYRSEQIDFLDKIIAEKQYEGYDKVLVFCHIPLNTKRNELMPETYIEWAKRLNVIKPDVMVCAHEHYAEFVPAGYNLFGEVVLEFPMHIGSVLEAEWIDDVCHLLDFAGTAMEVGKDKITLKIAGEDFVDREVYTVDLQK